MFSALRVLLSGGQVLDCDLLHSERILAWQDEAYPIEQQQEQEPQSETVFLVDQEASGALHVTGMLQKFRLDGAGFSTFNSLLTRPQTSYIDLSWSNW